MNWGVLAVAAAFQCFAIPAFAELTPEARYALTERALSDLGAPAEADLTELWSHALVARPERATADEWQARAASLFFRDPSLGAAVFTSESDVLHGFKDRDSKQVPDFVVPFADRPAVVAPFPSRMRIAIDPGHMGGAEWDAITGKFIRESRAPGARMLSEGELALHTALLLEQRLKALGHEVMLTRRTLTSVSRLPLEALSLQEWGLRALRQKSWMNWFTALLPSYEREGVSAFERSPQYQKLFAESQRAPYYVTGEDLHARTELIEAFRPDLTLILHLDISGPPKDGDPNGLSESGEDVTKVYVPGAFFGDEFASSEDRALAAIQGLNHARWSRSVTIAQRIVREIGSQLGVAPDPSDMNNSVRVSEGVYARNLHLTRKITHGAIAYVESLVYNAPLEFEAFSTVTGPGSGVVQVGDQSVRYSARLAQLVQALLSAVQSLSER